MSVVARPPLVLGRGKNKSLKNQLKRIAGGLWRVFWQAFVPFNPQPEPPEDPPRPRFEIPEAQLEQCKKIFDEVETSRNFLEGKARSTFSVVTFLAPLVATFFVFIFGRTTPGTIGRMVAIAFAGVSFVSLLLGFLSIARAVSVQPREILSLGAILDFGTGAFRSYNKALHARGLLYCASVNQAMNDHIAQFVKGAHILTAISVVALVAAALPAVFLISKDSPLTKTEIVGSVQISSQGLDDIRKNLAELSRHAAELANNKNAGDRFNSLDMRIEHLTSGVNDLRIEIERLKNRVASPSRSDGQSSRP
jgi:hypothetical protein